MGLTHSTAPISIFRISNYIVTVIARRGCAKWLISVRAVLNDKANEAPEVLTLCVSWAVYSAITSNNDLDGLNCGA